MGVMGASWTRAAGAPIVATNDVLYHGPERRPLQDILTCVREHCAIHEAGFRLEANAERHIKTPDEMARLFERWPRAVERTVEIVERIDSDIFPPKTDALMAQLWDVVETLGPLQPKFVSVTYGAGGSTRDRTHGTVARIIKEARLPAAAHLTCVDATKAEIREVAESYWEAGVRHIVALRGDMGAPGVPFTPHPDGYANAAELVAGLKEIAPFEISVAAYPESHPDSPSQQADIDNLKRKLDAGATRAISQFFFEPETFFRFRDKLAAAGIDAPVLPGILPVSNVAQTRKFAAACGAAIPAWMDGLFEGLDTHPA